MHPMQIQPECRPCLKRLVDQTVSLATTDPERRRQARDAALAIVEQDFGPEAIPARIANRCHLAIAAISGNPDPFAARKALETAYLSRLYPRLAPAYGQDLKSLLKLAVAGNAVDFFRSEEEVTAELSGQVKLGASDLPDFQHVLNLSPGLLLYLADNAGEQFFDLPLVAHLRRRGWEVLYVVKAGPVQNDLTRKDLYASGLGEALEPVIDTGALTVGLVLEETSPAFRKLYHRAGLIIAKGMGHFETLSYLNDPRLYFLLQAKCAPVARALGVPRRTFVCARAGAISLDTPGREG